MQGGYKLQVHVGLVVCLHSQVYPIVLRLRRVRCVSVYVCVLLLLLFLLSRRRLEAKLFFLGVDALADPIHALLKGNFRETAAW